MSSPQTSSSDKRGRAGKSKETPYNTEFVKKIQKSRKDMKDGKGTAMTLEEIQNLCK
jgi:hypothetical protein